MTTPTLHTAAMFFQHAEAKQTWSKHGKLRHRVTLSEDMAAYEWHQVEEGHHEGNSSEQKDRCREILRLHLAKLRCPAPTTNFRQAERQGLAMLI